MPISGYNFLRGVVMEVFLDDENSSFGISGPRIQFDIQKVTNLEPNRGSIKIINLNPEKRAKLQFRDRTQLGIYGNEVRLSAGYYQDMKQIYRGNITEAINYKRGVDWITELECHTFIRELLTAKISRATSYPKGTRLINIVKDLLSDLGLTVTKRTKTYLQKKLGSKVIQKSMTMQGSAAEALNRLSRNLSDYINCHITDEGIDLLPVGVASNSVPITLSKKTGLIGTPEITHRGIVCTHLIRHDINISTKILVISDTVESLKTGGTYVVDKVTYRGDNRQGDFLVDIQAVYTKYDMLVPPVK